LDTLAEEAGINMLRVSPLLRQVTAGHDRRAGDLRSSTVVILVENMVVNYGKPPARKEITFGDGFTPTP